MLYHPHERVEEYKEDPEAKLWGKESLLPRESQYGGPEGTSRTICRDVGADGSCSFGLEAVVTALPLCGCQPWQGALPFHL